MGLPVINIRETDKLSRAMKSGSSFYISDKNLKLLVPVPETEKDELNEELLEVFDKDFLLSALEEAEKCTAFVTLEEHKARMDKIIYG